MNINWIIVDIKGRLKSDTAANLTEDVLLHLLTIIFVGSHNPFSQRTLLHSDKINLKALIHKMNLDTIDSRLHKGETSMTFDLISIVASGIVYLFANRRIHLELMSFLYSMSYIQQ